MGKCMVAMVRKYASSAQVGLHASAWAAGHDSIYNADASLDVAAQGRDTSDFLSQCGAGASDLVVVDIADRDAGYDAAQGRAKWLDAANQKLPDFAEAFAWARAVADRTGRPLVWWQIPVGNSGLPNHDGAWRDNRVEYFFAHPDQVAGSGAVAMAFGAGAGDQTTPESDGGYLAACAAALEAAGGQPLCP
jgi:hypothetical protein